MFKGEKWAWAERVTAWAASLRENGLEIFQDLVKIRSEHDLESLELCGRGPENKDLKKKNRTSSSARLLLAPHTTLDGYVAGLRVRSNARHRSYGSVQMQSEPNTSPN